MSLKIYSADDIPKNEWENLTGKSLFSSPGLASLWKVMGGRPTFLINRGGGKLLSGMAGLEFGSGYLKRFYSMADGLYGGPYYADYLSDLEKARHWNLMTKYFLKPTFARVVIYNPINKIPCDKKSIYESSTHIIRLEGNKFSVPNPKTRTDIRASQKSGCTISLFSEEKYLDDFYRLVEMTSQRHKRKSRYSKEFFGGLFRLARTDDRIIWLMAIYDGNMIASHIRFIEGSQILCWQSFSNKEFRHLNPNHLLLDHLVNIAVERKIEMINLGGSPHGAESLEKYKESWGGKKVRYPYYMFCSPLGKALNFLRGR
jgi:hypothetical protein